jgi:UDP-2,4-diacetamido-2,4,6-trideoxy-beta-L-altropyranose hydrolase
MAWRQRLAPPLVVLDDFLNPPHGASLVINGAFHLSAETVDGIPALLGPDYALVGPRFAALPVRDFSRPVREIVITFGRLDPDNATGLALAALGETGTDASITVVLSSGSPHVEAIAGAVEALGRRGRLAFEVPDMHPVLATADMVIGAGGVSLMERMAAGLPSATLIIAENQRLFVEGAARLGGTLACTADKADLARTLRTFLEDAEMRAAMSAAARRIVDGNGPARVAQRMMKMAAPVSSQAAG